MKELKEYEYLDNNFYEEVKDVLEQARKRIYRNIQNEMILAYWQIGKMIVERQGGVSRAKYGDGLIRIVSSNDYRFWKRIYRKKP